MTAAAFCSVPGGRVACQSASPPPQELLAAFVTEDFQRRGARRRDPGASPVSLLLEVLRRLTQTGRDLVSRGPLLTTQDSMGSIPNTRSFRWGNRYSAANPQPSENPQPSRNDAGSSPNSFSFSLGALGVRPRAEQLVTGFSGVRSSRSGAPERSHKNACPTSRPVSRPPVLYLSRRATQELWRSGSGLSSVGRSAAIFSASILHVLGQPPVKSLFCAATLIGIEQWQRPREPAPGRFLVRKVLVEKPQPRAAPRQLDDLSRDLRSRPADAAEFESKRGRRPPPLHARW